MEKPDYQKIFSQRLVKLTGRSAFVYDPEEFLQKKLQTVLAEEGTLTGYNCPKCKNRGSIPFIRDGEIVFRRCDCADIRATLARMEASGLKDVLNKSRFSLFQATEPWQAKAKEAAISYARNPEGWFFIGGQSGCGKTHLCCAIAARLMAEGKRLVYMPWCEDSQKIKMGRYEDKQILELLQKIKTAPVLYIDDLLKTPAGPQGRTKPTGGDISLAFEVINYRYLQNLPTVISTELYPEELSAIDEALAGRIMERSGKNTLRIGRDVSKNYRMKSVLEL